MNSTESIFRESESQCRELLRYNRDEIKKIHELNKRAGRNLLKVPTRKELKTLLLVLVQGARNKHEVKDFAAVMLELVDPAVAEQIEQDNPLKIDLLGQEVGVNYNYTRPFHFSDEEDEDGDGASAKIPSIVLSAEVSKRWEQLPDGGVFLPGGRQVKVSLTMGTDILSELDIPALKAQVRKHLLKKEWENWVKPELPPTADLRGEKPFPEVLKVEKTTPDRRTLVAFGTFKHDSVHHDPGSTPIFEPAWFQFREDAEWVRDRSIQLVGEWKERLEAVELEKDLSPIRNRIHTLFYQYCYGTDSTSLSVALHQELTRLHSHPGGAAYGSLSEKKRWLPEAKALLTKFQNQLGCRTDQVSRDYYRR